MCVLSGLVRPMYGRDNANKRGYGHKWRKSRLVFLANNPLCVYCQREGRITAANVVDHIVPHKGDQKLFWDETNWQSLCKECHDSEKKREEHGTIKPIGLDGWPLDYE